MKFLIVHGGRCDPGQIDEVVYSPLAVGYNKMAALRLHVAEASLEQPQALSGFQAAQDYFIGFKPISATLLHVCCTRKPGQTCSYLSQNFSSEDNYIDGGIHESRRTLYVLLRGWKLRKYLMRIHKGVANAI